MKVRFSVLIAWASLAQAFAQSPPEACSQSSSILNLEEQACPDSNSASSSTTVGPASVLTCCPAVFPGQDQRRLSSATTPNTPSRLLQGGEECRSVQVEEPYCVPEESGCSAASTTLTLNFFFEYFSLDSTELCCSECICWGDPRCVSFDGERDEWLICDDRRPSDCMHKPGRCNAITDHLDQPCEFVRRTRKKKNGFEEPFLYRGFEEDGSPCQSSAIFNGTGPFPEMLMYEANGNRVSLTLGERGVITSMAFTTGTLGTFEIEAAACIGDTSDAVWTNTNPDAQVPDTWTVNQVNPNEVLWNIQSTDFTMFADVTCAKITDFRSRLDVEILLPFSSDDRNDQSILTETGGFCFTNMIEGRTPGALTREESEQCLFDEIGGCLEACKALVTPACNSDNKDDNLHEWCSENDLSGLNTPLTEEECFDVISNEENCTITSQNWADIVCQLDNPDDDVNDPTSGYAKCMMEIEDFGWYYYVDNRPPTSVDTVQPGECVDNVADYPESKPDECAVGVEVQYFIEGEGWITRFFIPIDSPPCNNELVLSGADFPELILNPIRLAQCESISTVCNRVNECIPTNGFEVSFEFEDTNCPTPEPTPSPSTGEPTMSPTTLAPTPNPTTEAPTFGRPTCYNCELFPDAIRPKICEFPDEFVTLGNCEQCCEPDDDEPPPPVTDQGRCRNQRTLEPYCDIESEPELCESLGNNDGLLEFRIKYDLEVDPEFCCLECAAYGDPELSSFQATGLQNLSVWIICDGRDNEGGGSCPITQAQCESQLDHEGRQCFFNQTKFDLLADVYTNIGVVGSPCEINPDSEPAVFNLYTSTTQGETFQVDTVLGERAVITSTIVTTNAGEFVITASECFGEPEDAWEGDVFSNFNKIEFDTEDQRVTPNGAERRWRLTDPSTGNFLQITCIRQEGGPPVEGLTSFRLNVDSIIERDIERVNLGTGYCPSGIVDFQQSTPTETEEGSVFFECTWSRWPQALSICKSLVDTACTVRQVPDGVMEWCRTANVFQDRINPFEACVDEILGEDRGSSTVRIGNRWARQYCVAIANNMDNGQSQNQFINNCITDIEEMTFGGIQNKVDLFGRGEVNNFNTCLENPEYGMNDDVCERGIFVEYEDEGEWIESFFVPLTQLPCSGIVSVSFNDYPELFTHPIRFRQCQQVDENDQCTTDIVCLPALGYEIEYKFSQRSRVCD